MKDPQLDRLKEIMGRDDDVRLMVRLVLDSEGATSLQHLRDISRETFDMLCSEAESLVEQGTP